MRLFLCLAMPFVIFSGCTNSTTVKDYRVGVKDSGNFSIQFPELISKERIVIKLNNETILDKIGEDTLGSPGFWRYYNYPKTIKKIQFLDYYKGKLKIEMTFHDTLVNVKQRTLIVSRPIAKGITKESWRPHGFVSIDTGHRSIILVNDAVAFKGMWTDY